MKAELICTGTELLHGKTNTNASLIGEKLSAIGCDLSRITTVGDDRAALEQALRRALEENVLVLVTGGLGPTFDDITREAAAAVLGLRLVVDREALAAIARFFVSRGREMAKNNERQAYILEGASVLSNAAGTAPGQYIGISRDGGGKTLLFLLPGPPRELQLMFDAQVMPRLKPLVRRKRKSLTLHVTGLAESEADEKIRPIIDAERRLEKEGVNFSIVAHGSLIDIRVSVSDADELLVDEMLHNLRQEFAEVLGDNIFGESRQTLESVTGELLGKARMTVAVAESCTGGLIAQKLTSVSGSSVYFREGAVTYANEAKVRVLGVSPDTLKEHGAVSEATAIEMARGMKKAAGTDYALAVTGIAGPSGGTPEKPVGLVYIGIAGPDGEAVHRFQFPGSRTEIRESAAVRALDLLRRALMAVPAKGPDKKRVR